MTQFAGTSISQFWTADQWSYIRKNLGEWRGKFIQFSPDATLTSETPSVLTLEEDRRDHHMTLVLKRTPAGQLTHTVERELGYPGAAPYICFLPTGAFSQGVMQRQSWSSFGAEFSLLSGHRRMRLVQLYNGTTSGDHILDYVTLIPEERSDNLASEVELSMETLLGTWQGETLYLPATMDSPQIGTSHWQALRSETDVILSTTIELPGANSQSSRQRFTSLDRYRWQAIAAPQQLWLLPGGVTCTVYPQLPRQHGTQLEFCWYLSPQQRQRLVRDYDTTGSWMGTSLILETRV